MKSKIFAFFLICILCCISTTTYADDQFELSSAVITPLEKNEKAPYQGILLSPEAIANIIADYKAFEEKMKIELERQKREEEAQKKFEINNIISTCNADKKILDAKLKRSEGDNKLLLEEQKKLEKSQKNVLIWTLAGTGAGILVGTSITYLLLESDL